MHWCQCGTWHQRGCLVDFAYALVPMWHLASERLSRSVHLHWCQCGTWHQRCCVVCFVLHLHWCQCGTWHQRGCVVCVCICTGANVALGTREDVHVFRICTGANVAPGTSEDAQVCASALVPMWHLAPERMFRFVHLHWCHCGTWHQRGCALCLCICTGANVAHGTREAL